MCLDFANAISVFYQIFFVHNIALLPKRVKKKLPRSWWLLKNIHLGFPHLDAIPPPKPLSLPSRPLFTIVEYCANDALLSTASSISHEHQMQPSPTSLANTFAGIPHFVHISALILFRIVFIISEKSFIFISTDVVSDIISNPPWCLSRAIHDWSNDCQLSIIKLSGDATIVKLYLLFHNFTLHEIQCVASTSAIFWCAIDMSRTRIKLIYYRYLY
jgi:hypothetical protein